MSLSHTFPEEVVLVNSRDEETGTMEKTEAHRKGMLHRALSVFVFNSRGEMLLQLRAADKYHSAGLWSNTCCSHPRPGEPVAAAAMRRLQEEMGMTCNLVPAFTFIYKCTFENGLTEHELDHVFIGTTDATPEVNRLEATDWKYMLPQQVITEIKSKPHLYSVWFRLLAEKVIDFRNATED